MREQIKKEKDALAAIRASGDPPWQRWNALLQILLPIEYVAEKEGYPMEKGVEVQKFLLQEAFGCKTLKLQDEQQGRIIAGELIRGILSPTFEGQVDALMNSLGESAGFLEKREALSELFYSLERVIFACHGLVGDEGYFHGQLLLWELRTDPKLKSCLDQAYVHLSHRGGLALFPNG